MQACILRRVLGTQLDLLFNTQAGTFLWVDGVPENAWVAGDASADLSLDVLAKLCCLPLVLEPPAPFMRSMQVLGASSPIRWRHVLPDIQFRRFMDGILGDTRALGKHQGVAYYLDILRHSRVFLASLARARVDNARLEAHMRAEGNETNRMALWSMTPDADGFAQPVVYDTVSTVTGRLVVVSGPRITTLAKRHRDVITSRYPGGRIVSIDFKSLEPRVILHEMGRPAPDDIYADIQSRLTVPLDREHAKAAVISMLYGAGEATVSRVSGLKGRDLFDAMGVVGDFFQLEQLLDDLETRYAEGTLTNSFGRPLGRGPKKIERRKLINLFAQSSAVDRCLLGFRQGVELIRREGWLIEPIFNIHDALILDAHQDHLGYIDRVAAECSRCPVQAGCSRVGDTDAQTFPVKVEEMKS